MLESCNVGKLGNSKVGRLGGWNIGMLECWKVEKLESWEVGKFGSWKVRSQKLKSRRLEKSGPEIWEVFVAPPPPRKSVSRRKAVLSPCKDRKM